jgi:hypothetical protein
LTPKKSCCQLFFGKVLSHFGVGAAAEQQRRDPLDLGLGWRRAPGAGEAGRLLGAAQQRGVAVAVPAIRVRA